MKRFCVAAMMMLVTAVPVPATSPIYYNNGNVTEAPVIDAINFVNEGRFTVATGLPFEFSSVLNYTNRSLMQNGLFDDFFGTRGSSIGFSSGFRFDTAPATDTDPPRKPAANFYNAPLAGNVASNATISGDFQLLVQATNIFNRGAIRVSEFGLVSLAGRTVDTSRGVLQTGDFGVRTPTLPQGILDNYWNFGAHNINPSSQFTLANPFTTPYTVFFFPPPYLTNLFSLSLAPTGTEQLEAREFITEVGTNRSVQIVFVRTADPDIHTRIVKFGGFGGEPGTTMVEWSAYHTNNILGRIQTNFLFLQDSFAPVRTSAYVTNYPFTPPPPSITTVPPRSLQPANFDVSRPAPFGVGAAGLGAAFSDKPASFWSTGGPVVTGAVFSAYGITVKTSLARAEDATAVRGAAGRVEVKADKILTADLLQAEAMTYLKLDATNHFAGSSNAYITAPFSDIALASTNGFLNMSSVLQPIVHRLNGGVDMYSVVWTNNVFFNGTTNPVLFNVLMVDCNLSNTAPAQIFDASLQAASVEVGDSLNVLNNLSIDADRLNITSNGVITIGNSGIAWETSIPHLKTLTNSGTILGINTLTFISHNANGTAKPIDGIVNYGTIQGAGVTMTAHDLFNQGSLSSLNGPLAINASTNITLPFGGSLSALEEDINIFCRNLFITNHSVLAGRTLNLNVTDQLLAGTNDWQVFHGFSLPVRPTNSELGNVIIRSMGILNQPVTHVWSGSDRGVQGSGFVNNAALGMLVLDGALNTMFTFTGNGAPSNALYVDRLELTNSAGLFDNTGNLKEVTITPGMMVYYAQATINGASAAEFLDGKNGGQLRWVSSHAGSFSGTNVVYPDGSTNFLNTALVTSCNLDSDNDGTPNCIDPSPVPLLARAQLTAKIVNNPNPMLSLSWLTVGWATNRFYTATNIKAPAWQFFTNIVSPPQAGPPFTKEFFVPLNSSRFYRVDVVTPPQ